MRVLVVDDDKLVAMSLKTILEAEGKIAVPQMGYDGSEAITLYRKGKTGCTSYGYQDAGRERLRGGGRDLKKV